MIEYPSGPESGATPGSDLWLDESPRPESVIEAERERKQRNYGDCPGCGAWLAREDRTHCLSCEAKRENGNGAPGKASSGVVATPSAITPSQPFDDMLLYAVKHMRAQQPTEPAWIWDDDALESRVPKLEARVEKLEAQLANMEGVLAMAVHVATVAADTVKGRAG